MVTTKELLKAWKEAKRATKRAERTQDRILASLVNGSDRPMSDGIEAMNETGRAFSAEIDAEKTYNRAVREAKRTKNKRAKQ